MRDGLVSEQQAVGMRAACDAAQVSVQRRALKVGRARHDAMLVPTRHGFTALVDAELWDRAAEVEAARRHVRFVLAHELAHTLFYEPGSPPSRPSAPDAAEERFCDGFATFLLVPGRAAGEASLDPTGLRGLAKRFDVSLRVAAWAISRTRPEVSILEFRRSEHPRGGREAMRLRWGASRHFLARGESLKSSLAELAPGEFGSCVQRLRLGGREHHLELRAWRQASSLLVFATKHESVPESASPGAARTATLSDTRTLTLFA